MTETRALTYAQCRLIALRCTGGSVPVREADEALIKHMPDVRHLIGDKGYDPIPTALPPLIPRRRFPVVAR